MAGARPFVERFHRWALRRGFPVLLWLAPRLPRAVLHAGARVVMFIVFSVYREPNADIEANLARVLDKPLGSRVVRRARREMIRHLGYYWTDLFRFAQLPGERMVELLADVRGFERVEAALGEGHGALLLTAHLGNWELGGVLLGKRSHRISVVYVPDKFPDVEMFRSQLRRGCQVDEIPLRPEERLGSLPALRALREGRLLALQGDRDFNDRGAPHSFFGAPVRFPTGPFALAQATGAPILPTFIVYTPDRRFAIEIGEPIRVGTGAGAPGDADRRSATAAAGRAAALEMAMAEWVQVLESAVGRWPTQWYTFYDFWNPKATAPPVTTARAA